MGMNMDFRLQQCPSLALILRCGTCKQSIDDAEIDTAALQVQLFGRVNYAICPTCFQEVPDHTDRGYRCRVGKVIRLARCRAIKERKEQER